MVVVVGVGVGVPEMSSPASRAVHQNGRVRRRLTHARDCDRRQSHLKLLYMSIVPLLTDSSEIQSSDGR